MDHRSFSLRCKPHFACLIPLGLVVVSLACSLPWQLGEEAELQETLTPVGGKGSEDFEAGDRPSGGGPEPCPKEPTMFALFYDHTLVMEPSPEFHFEETSDPGGLYTFWVDQDGRITTPTPNEIMLTTKGWIKSPDSDECPITNYDGTYPLRAEITGSCRNGKIHLVVKQLRANFELYADCPERVRVPSPVETISAPEIDHTFQIINDGDVYKLEGPDFGPIRFTYLWVLRPGRPVFPEPFE